jgi:hypothetical protein
MYCVIETQFYCDGSAGHCAPKFNAMLADLKTLLDRHPGVTCTAFDEDEWALSGDDLQELPGSEADLGIDDGQASAD